MNDFKGQSEIGAGCLFSSSMSKIRKTLAICWNICYNKFVEICIGGALWIQGQW